MKRCQEGKLEIGLRKSGGGVRAASSLITSTFPIQKEVLSELIRLIFIPKQHATSKEKDNVQEKGKTRKKNKGNHVDNLKYDGTTNVSENPTNTLSNFFSSQAEEKF